MTDEAAKAKARQERKRSLFAFLDKRIPELHKAGVRGSNAKYQALAEYAKR